MWFQAGESSGQVRRVAVRTMAVLGFLALGLSVASADACSILKTRYAGATAELRQIDGRVRAIRVAAGRECESDGGFFDPCRRSADRLAQSWRSTVQAHQAASAKRAAIHAQLASYRCLEQTVRAPRATVRAAKAVSAPKPASSPAAMLYCVRPSDGYFFPAPNAQFVGVEAASETRDRCRFICEDAEMDVYVLDDVTAGTETMVSAAGRRPYSELAGAHAYRQTAGFRRCDMQRYHDRIDEARARTATPASIGDVVMPLPSARPRATEADLMLAFRGSLSDLEMPPNAIRVVGASYFPE